MPGKPAHRPVALSTGLAWLWTAVLPGHTAYVAGQVAFDSRGKVVGAGTDLKNLAALREARARYFDATHPPANTLIPVTTLANPDLLLEIKAVVDLH